MGSRGPSIALAAAAAVLAGAGGAPADAVRAGDMLTRACRVPCLAVDAGQLAPAAPVKPEEKPPPETIEADVSTRSVAVTSGFAGTEIIVFGTVANSRQKTSDEGYYDVVVAVEGLSVPIVARRKRDVAGVWINMEAIRFKALPSYYAVASTRPLDDVADAKTREQLSIGFDHVVMTPQKKLSGATAAELADFKKAVIRLKQDDDLYIREDYGVSFIGRSLFRASINLPANVPVGPLTARVFLFREGQLLSQYSAQVTLEREGVERFLHGFAFNYPLLYGLLTVALAVSAGLTASLLVHRVT